MYEDKIISPGHIKKSYRCMLKIIENHQASSFGATGWPTVRIKHFPTDPPDP